MKRLNSAKDEVYERYIRWHQQKQQGTHASIIAQRAGYPVNSVYYGIRRINELLSVDASTRRVYKYVVRNDQAKLIKDVKKLIQKPGVPRELKSKVKELIQIIIYNDEKP